VPTPVQYRECSKCQRRRADRFFVGTRGRVCASCRKKGRKRTSREAHVQRTYEVTPNEYKKILKTQGGKCVCGRPPRDVDHDHAIEKLEGIRASVRGVLCRSCNIALSKVRDDPERLRALARYLENPPAYHVIVGS
jgi:hypothetical protein